MATWTLIEDGYDYETACEAGSAEEALKIARKAVDGSNYWNDENDRSTIWIDVRVRCNETGEEDADTVRVDPPAPKCVMDHEHHWISPFEIVRGIEENPGVWGHGGGVKIHEVCEHCGCARITDTWAQDSRGREGLTSVGYDRDLYREEWREWSDARERHGGA